MESCGSPEQIYELAALVAVAYGVRLPLYLEARDLGALAGDAVDDLIDMHA